MGQWDIDSGNRSKGHKVFQRLKNFYGEHMMDAGFDYKKKSKKSNYDEIEEIRNERRIRDEKNSTFMNYIVLIGLAIMILMIFNFFGSLI